MTHVRMHDDELDIDDTLVRRLLRAQMPQWADLPLERVISSGTDNAMFRLGDDLVMRMPRVERAVPRLEAEHKWLPALAPHVPLAMPTLLAKGEPGQGYPWIWSVYSWIDGDNAFDTEVHDLGLAARDVAALITALHAIDTATRRAPHQGGAALHSRPPNDRRVERSRKRATWSTSPR